MKILKFLSFGILIITFSCNIYEDNFPIIAGHYKLAYSPLDEIMLVKNDTTSSREILIPGHILFYAFNSDYLIAIQKNRNKIDTGEGLPLNKQLEKIYSSIFSEYYILNVKNNNVFGPFNKIEYLKMRKELSIPESLKFNKSTLEHYLKGQRNDIQYKNPDSEVVDIKILKGNENSSF